MRHRQQRPRPRVAKRVSTDPSIEPLAGVRVLLGVCGGIAATKTPALVRRLREAGAEVRTALTRHATSFVTPLTLEVMSGNAVLGEEYLEANGSGEELHITLGDWADVVVIAPLTTNTLARLALGLGDDFLTTTLLAWDGPLVLVPAMHPRMWLRASTQEHVDTLTRRGARFVGPVSGALASGESGPGRMVEPEDIVADLVAHQTGTDSALPWAGRLVVINAGPTREPVDPVRYVSNRSTGRMGYALAREAARRGARVVLVSGPVALSAPPGVLCIDVETAVEMRDAVYARVGDADLVVLTAAVADFRPGERSRQKVKKQDLEGAAGEKRLTLELVENPDILAGLHEVAPHALRVGFAAETEKLEEYAQAKVARKNVDLIVANDVSDPLIGFGSVHNAVRVFDRDGEVAAFDRRPKNVLAGDLFDLFEARLSLAETTS